MCHLKHRLRIFLFRRKIVFRSQDIQVFVFLTIPWFTWDKVHFWIYLLNHKSWSDQTSPVDRYKQVQYFSVIFWTIWETGALPLCCSSSSHKQTISQEKLSFYLASEKKLRNIKMTTKRVFLISVAFEHFSCNHLWTNCKDADIAYLLSWKLFKKFEFRRLPVPIRLTRSVELWGHSCYKAPEKFQQIM